MSGDELRCVENSESGQVLRNPLKTGPAWFFATFWARLEGFLGPVLDPLGAVLAIFAASGACLAPVLASKVSPQVAPKRRWDEMR